MNCPARLLALGIAGFCMGATCSAHGQTAESQSTSRTSGSGPGVGVRATDVAGARETRQLGAAKGASGTAPTGAAPMPSRGATTPSASEATRVSTDKNEQSKKESHSQGSGASAPDKGGSAGGGYSWSAKKQSSTRPHVAPRIDPTRPLAHAPNFFLRSDGSSLVTLVLSRPTVVSRRGKGGRVEYRLKDAQVGVMNNTNPLVTAHFATPVTRITLRQVKRDATLTFELRENVDPAHQIKTGPAGSSILEVTLPKPTRAYAVSARERPGPSKSKTAQAEGSSKSGRVKANHSSSKTGPGPRL